MQDSPNVPRLSELYFLNSMLEGDSIDPRPFLVMHSASPTFAHRIVIGGLITPIARLVGD